MFFVGHTLHLSGEKVYVPLERRCLCHSATAATPWGRSE
jgi:hypothetical protein